MQSLIRVRIICSTTWQNPSNDVILNSVVCNKITYSAVLFFYGDLFMNSYKHTVQYYETDRMGITHHSNYIRWMEEARVDYLNQIGWGYDRIEENGIVSPVIGIKCKYKNSTTFADVIEIKVTVSELKGVTLKLHYLMTKEDGQIVFEGYSEHCFMNKDGRMIRLAKEYPAFYELLEAAKE